MLSWLPPLLVQAYLVQNYATANRNSNVYEQAPLTRLLYPVLRYLLTIFMHPQK